MLQKNIYFSNLWWWYIYIWSYCNLIFIMHLMKTMVYVQFHLL